MTPTMILVLLAVAAAFVCATGVQLTMRGRPYNDVLQTLHKIVALGATIVVSFLAYRAGVAGPFTAVGSFAAVTAAILLLVSFVTGGLVNGRADAPDWVLWVHRGGSWLAVLAAAVIMGIVTGAF